MRIDAHQHFWVYNPSEYGWIDDSMTVLRRDFLPGDLKARTRWHRISWLYRHPGAAKSGRDTLASQVSLRMAVYSWRGRVGNLRSPHLRSDLQVLAKNPKLVGVRHIVQSEPDERFLLQPEFLRGISLLEEFDLAYDILIYEKHLSVAAEFVRRFPRQRFVLDHAAKPRIKDGILHPWAGGIRELAVFPNVFCKLSGLVTEADWHEWRVEQITPYLDVAFECFGADRLMIGSDWPVCTVAASYSRSMAAVNQVLGRCGTEASEKVLGANAQRFYKLKVPERWARTAQDIVRKGDDSN